MAGYHSNSPWPSLMQCLLVGAFTLAIGGPVILYLFAPRVAQQQQQQLESPLLRQQNAQPYMILNLDYTYDEKWAGLDDDDSHHRLDVAEGV